MRLAGLDGPLAELISPCTDPARLDASQDRRFRHADSFRGLPEGVTHVLRSVPRTDPRNGAGGTVDGRLTARGAALVVGALGGRIYRSGSRYQPPTQIRDLRARAPGSHPLCGFKMTLTYSSATRPNILFALGDESVNVICICWSRPLCGSL